jgi:hypothetical protein
MEGLLRDGHGGDPVSIVVIVIRNIDLYMFTNYNGGFVDNERQ